MRTSIAAAVLLLFLLSSCSLKPLPFHIGNSNDECELLGRKRVAKKVRQPKMNSSTTLAARRKTRPSDGDTSRGLPLIPTTKENMGTEQSEHGNDAFDTLLDDEWESEKRSVLSAARNNASGPSKKFLTPANSVDQVSYPESLPDHTTVALAGAMLASLAIVGIGFAGFNSRFMRVSAWGARNPKMAKSAIATVYVLTAIGAYGLGGILASEGEAVSSMYLTTGVASTMLAVLAYPRKTGSLQHFTNRYLRQKYCDMTLYAAATAMVVFAGNQLPAYPGALPINASEVVIANSVSADDTHDSIDKPTKRKLGEKVNQNKPKSRGGQKALAIALFVIGMVVVAALSCGLACSGNGIAAVAVLGVGVTGGILLLRSALKSINAKNRADREAATTID